MRISMYVCVHLCLRIENNRHYKMESGKSFFFVIFNDRKIKCVNLTILPSLKFILKAVVFILRP